MNSSVVLSIFPNAKGFGYACMHLPATLIDYGVISPTPLENNKLVHKLTQSIHYLQPTIILIRDPMNQRGAKSKRLQSFIKDVESLSSKFDLPVFQYTRDDIIQAFESLQVKTKFEINQQLVKQFPELRFRLPKKRLFYESEDNQQALFDAVSLITAYLYFEKDPLF